MRDNRERIMNIIGATALVIAAILTVGHVWNALQLEPAEEPKEVYTYHITAVLGDEIYGIPAEGEASDDNGGVFLYAHEVDFVLDEGDVIEVVWESEDVFESIELLPPAGDKDEIGRLLDEIKRDQYRTQYAVSSEGGSRNGK